MLASTLAQITGGQWHGLEGDPQLGAAICDTRLLQEGDVFVALKAERDGHDFVPQAFDMKAVAAITEHVIEGGPCLVVEHSEKALQEWAKAHRQYMTATVIAVVGSVGKTTAKEVMSHLLSASYKVHKSPRSYNNHLGVPMTLLSAPADCDYVVLEMGANGPGDLDLLGSIATPDHLFVVPIGAAHLEGFKTLEGVYRAKSEVMAHLKPTAIVVWPQDDTLHRIWNWKGSSFTYGDNGECQASDVTLQFPNTLFVLQGQQVKVPVPALYMGSLVAGIKTLCDKLEIKVDLDDLKTYQAAGGRLEVHQSNDLTVINDAYNANPESVSHAIDMLESATGRRLMVFGDMLEMGSASEKAHQRVGQQASKQLDILCCVGTEAKRACHVFEGESHEFDNAEDCQNFLLDYLKDGDTVLVKASNSMGLALMAEKLIERKRSA